MASRNKRVLEPFVEVALTGQTTYLVNGKCTLDFDRVPDIAGLLPSVRGIVIEGSLVFQHDAGAPVAMQEEIPFRAIEKLFLQGKKTKHVYLDLDEQAGWAAYVVQWFLTGKKPQRHGGGGNVSLTNGTTTTVRISIYIPFILPASAEPDDVNTVLADLLKSQLEITWANADAGGVFDSGANNERLTSASTLRCFLDLIGRENELYRGGPRLSIRSHELPGLNERLPIANEKLLGLIEIPLHAAGVTPNRITDAERDLFRFTSDGDTPTNDVDVRDLSRHWSRLHARTADDELVHHETDASPWLPLVFPKRPRNKLPQTHEVDANPQVRFTGTDTTPKVITITTSRHDDGDVMRAIKDSGVELPPDFAADPTKYLSSKTLSKEGAGADVNSGLPYVVKKRPVR